MTTLEIHSEAPRGGKWAVLVHGGAGDIPEGSREAHITGCKRAAEAGAKILAAGGSALDAAQAAVRVLEDDPHFNAGTGACLTADETIELDASIMEGTTLKVGAVCAMPPFRNPIAIARAVLDDGAHVLYAAEGAARFAEAHGFTRAKVTDLLTDHARARFETLQKGGAAGGYAGGTVGAVAVDRTGHVAAATSTGGTSNKKPGRVGDSPIVGAGTYADDAAGACSCTGDGESFMRLCTAKAAIDGMRTGRAPNEVASDCMAQIRDRCGTTGGLILVDRQGRLGFARSTRTMSWGAMAEGDNEPRGGV